MLVLAIKPGHDGSVALVDEGELVYSLEAEKDSEPRHAGVTAQLLLDALTSAPRMPDIVALGGWHKYLPGGDAGVAAGYRGVEPGCFRRRELLGHHVDCYSSSHERSHIVCAVAMSPFAMDERVAVLVWEGIIGSLYLWEGHSQRIHHWQVLDQPGARYSSLFALANPDFPEHGGDPPSEYAGKMMALIGLADSQPPSADSTAVVEALLAARALYPFDKARFRRSVLHNGGVETDEFVRAARLLSNRLFETFHVAARRLLPPGLPLVIAGGCGLNCEWNSRWAASNHFTATFVPPCTDDSGSAIGTAVDALAAAGGPLALNWRVDRGAEFVLDCHPRTQGWDEQRLVVRDLAQAIDRGAVVAWVQGRSEIGPRALGHRSLLASPRRSEMRDLLNRMKGREGYRPIAPVCLGEDLAEWFEDATPDPYMLRFRRVSRPEALPAVTHADGSARVQSVGSQESSLRELLVVLRDLTGIGVLCNTSLNHRGRGFINRMSELLAYCSRTGVRNIVVGDRWYMKASPSD